MSKLIELFRNLFGITTTDSNQTARRHAQPRFSVLRDVDGIVVVRFPDLIAVVHRMDTMAGIERASKELLSVVDRKPLAVILDFEGTEFAPVASFENVLVRLHKNLNGKLRMCDLPARVAEQFKVNQLATVLQVHTDLDGALAAVKIPYLELSNGQRIPLVGDRLLVGRIPFDEEKHRNVLGISNEHARCEGEWLYLPDPHVSKQHAILTRTDDGYAIEDAESRGGTFVNDQPITERTLLKAGDTIKVGNLEMVYGDEITQGLNFLWQRFDGD